MKGFIIVNQAITQKPTPTILPTNSVEIPPNVQEAITQVCNDGIEIAFGKTDVNLDKNSDYCIDLVKSNYQSYGWPDTQDYLKRLSEQILFAWGKDQPSSINSLMYYFMKVGQDNGMNQ
ncbi:MAG: hypothetical protein ABSC49_04070 [Candidatus Microgenomates bacterium]